MIGGQYSPQQIAALKKLVDNDEAYSANCLKVLDKNGNLVPFLWNRAQKHIHECLEKQRAERGFVRALVLKGRQQGCSTYVAARFYRKTSTRKGRRAFIVSHEEKSTNNLFAMVKRYDDHNPMAPSKKASNAQELIFGRLDGGYKLATAGSQDVGRGNTAQLLHGSEFGYWQNAQKHLAGIGNSIPLQEGNESEIILESTANGLGNAFHEMWQAAERGEGDYIAIFVPWFWQDEYRMPVRDGFELSEADEKYMRAYGLDMEQMQWRASKIAEYGRGFAWLFDQEFPATPALAFQTSTQNPLVNPSDVMAAVNSTFFDMHGPVVLGCDPAEEGDDRTAVVWRQGRIIFRVEYHEKMRPMQVAGLLSRYWDEGLPKGSGPFTGIKPDAMLVDRIGIGAGIVDRLRELNIPHVGVHSGERADEPDLYINKRAEMWWRMKDYFEDAPCRMINDSALISDITAPQPEPPGSDNKKQLEPKKKMKKRGVRSPDGGDALALTFAHPVQYRHDTSQDEGTKSWVPASDVGY